ncbi:MAG: hypothetical protein WBB69_12445 [Anaerolineales bacterium]
MAARKRNILRGIMLMVIALSAFGFRYAPDTAVPVELSPSSDLEGYVDLLIFGDGLMHDGVNWTQFLWYPVQVQIPVTIVTPDGKGLIQGELVYTFGQGDGEAGGGLVTTQSGWPTKWEIDGILNPSPDCSLELFITEFEYPGYAITCSFLVGCFPDIWDFGFHPDMEIKVPFGQGHGEVDFDIYNTTVSGELTVIVLEQAGPDRACDFNLFLP